MSEINAEQPAATNAPTNPNDAMVIEKSKDATAEKPGEPPKKKAPAAPKEKLDQIVLEQYIMMRDFEKILRLAEKMPQQYREFKKVKYQEQIYSIGDSILVSTVKENQRVEQIGRLKRIVSIKSFVDDCELPLIVVNWYCNRDDMPPQYVEYAGCFSVYELFLTDVANVLFIDSIVHGVKVLPYEEYESQLGSTDERIYFMRSAYNTFQELLVPHPKEWASQCVCNLPPNPDLTYIFCENCQRWIHMICAKISEEEAKKIEVYVCRRCRD